MAIKQEMFYIYEAPVRIWHWVTALAITVLAITGYLIGSPLPSVPGEASEHFMMGNIPLRALRGRLRAGHRDGAADLLGLRRNTIRASCSSYRYGAPTSGRKSSSNCAGTCSSRTSPKSTRGTIRWPACS